MKQLTLTDVLKALGDEPRSIGDRLKSLGLTLDEIKGKFSDEVLGMIVYGSSFLRFLHDNSQAFLLDEPIAAKPLPADFQNPFDEKLRSIGDRLKNLDVSSETTKKIFSKDTLNLKVSGDEFQDFLLSHQDTLTNNITEIIGKGE
jgi:hypothetical protein